MEDSFATFTRNQIEIHFRFERRNGGDLNEQSEFFVASPFRRNPCFSGTR